MKPAIPEKVPDDPQAEKEKVPDAVIPKKVEKKLARAERRKLEKQDNDY